MGSAFLGQWRSKSIPGLHKYIMSWIAGFALKDLGNLFTYLWDPGWGCCLEGLDANVSGL